MFETLLLFFLVLFGFFIGPLSSWLIVKNSVLKIRQIKQCTVLIEAEIISWESEYDPDNGTWCTPTIRYSYLGNDYEVKFTEVPIDKRQKECDFSDNTVMISVNPNDPSTYTLNDGKRAISHQLHICIGWCGLCLFFLLLAIFLLSV